jgi:teichoic acid transport system ATP-binding protein
MAMNHAIEVRGLSKKYKSYPTPGHRILEALCLGRRSFHREHWALRDVEFDVPKGSALGIVGPNGAGKSTLMKILSGTTFQTSGSFRCDGRVSSMLELGAGFHAEFSGRENLIMNGIMMGYSRREMLEKFDEIWAFSELGDFIEEPLRTYSSGMAMRLGFSVAVAVDPDILIIDEIFAVGDMHFQKKCIDKIYQFRERGKTILFCSHSLYDIRQLCDQALWVRDGRVARIGDATVVTNEYAAHERALELDAQKLVEEEIPAAAKAERERHPRITEVKVYRPGSEEECYEFAPGEALDVAVSYENPDPARYPIHVGVGFLRNDQTLCIANSTHFDGVQVPGESGTAVLHIPRLQLLSGTFVVFCVILDGPGIHRYDNRMAKQDLLVLSRERNLGLFAQDHRWKIEVARAVGTGS